MSNGTNVSKTDLEALGYSENADGTFSRKPPVKTVPDLPKGSTPPKGRQPRQRNGLNQMSENIATKPWPNGELEQMSLSPVQPYMSIKPIVTTAEPQNIVFDIIPYGAPRMSRSDKWKTDPTHLDPKKRQRACVKHYFEYRQQLQRQAAEQGHKLTETLNITFYLPMPESWSKKKRERMNGQPHQVRCDLDNIIKGFLDSLTTEDGFVYDIHARKFWAEKGSIVVKL